MYGSVIVSYNLSKSSFREKKEKNSVGVEIDSGSGEKVYFSRERGFFPRMIEEMIEKRKEVKEAYNKNPSPLLKARSNAFKLLVNAAYGYQGFFGARYYCREAAAATAAFARKEIHHAIKEIEKKGYEVVYGDTDSIAFLQGKKSKKDVNGMLDEINKGLPGIMELDLEGFFKRGIWVSKRSGNAGAKKKYALLDDKNGMKIRGFETVRRDWCLLAREVQNKVLSMVLNNGNEKKALTYVEGIISKLKKREIELDMLVIKTQLKRAVNDYKSLGPHVVIAKRMIELGMKVNVGMLIEYYIAEASDRKKKLVRDRAKMLDEKGEYDIGYYLNNQILPAVENIFEVFGVNVRELVDGERQRGLGEF
jgi:DNA polymerase Pol2